MHWLPKKPKTEIFIPECPFRINPDTNRRVGQLHIAILHDELWLVSKEAARVCEKEIEFLCEADLYEGMLIDSRTRFLLPVLYPLWSPGEWSESLFKFARLAREKWVTVVPDVWHSQFVLSPRQDRGGDVIEWPNDNLGLLAEQAFAGRYIDKDFTARNTAFREALIESCDWR
jgi:hypothetical protein